MIISHPNCPFVVYLQWNQNGDRDPTYLLLSFYLLWLYMKIDSPTNPHQGLAPMIPWKQRYLSCMAFIVYEVTHLACIVCRLVALLRQTHANDFVNSKSHAGQKPLLTGYPPMKASFVKLKYWANKVPFHSRSISLTLNLQYHSILLILTARSCSLSLQFA